jgi:hypothetical protein
MERVRDLCRCLELLTRLTYNKSYNDYSQILTSRAERACIYIRLLSHKFPKKKKSVVVVVVYTNIYNTVLR